jgi:hypothetical protein
MQAIQRFRSLLARTATGCSAGSSPSYRRTTTSALWRWGLLLGWYVPTVLAGSQSVREPSTTESVTAAAYDQVFERDSGRMRSAESVRGKHRRRRGRIGRGRRFGRTDEHPDDSGPGKRR